jgi:hypothetical protein
LSHFAFPILLETPLNGTRATNPAPCDRLTASTGHAIAAAEPAARV